jgi:hypothetical protein
MAVQLTCDLCLKDYEKLDEIQAINDDYQVPGRVVHVCKKCSDKVNEKIKALSIYYGGLLGKDIREWLLEERNKTTKKLKPKTA